MARLSFLLSLERCEKLCGEDKDHQCARRCYLDPKGAPKLVGRCLADTGPLFGCFADVDGGKMKVMCVD
jgi:hypothetical protein